MNNKNNNETWDYEWYATEGALPVEITTSDANGISYNYVEDYLQINVTGASAYIKFNTNKTTSTNAIIETMVCANSLFSGYNGIRVQLSNGTFGCQIRISRYDSNDESVRLDKLYGNTPSNRKFIKYLDVNTFYKIRLVLEDNTTNVYVDDVLVDTSNTSSAGTENDVSYAEGCFTSSHGIFFQNSPTFGSIKYIKFKEF